MSKTFLICAATTLLLGACGGGGEPAAGMAIDEAVPASAAVTSEAFSRYVDAATAETRSEPLDLAALQAPGSETADPVELR